MSITAKLELEVRRNKIDVEESESKEAEVAAVSRGASRAKTLSKNGRITQLINGAKVI